MLDLGPPGPFSGKGHGRSKHPKQTAPFWHGKRPWALVEWDLVNIPFFVFAHIYTFQTAVDFWGDRLKKS